MSEWRDIESAPRDGSAVRLRAPWGYDGKAYQDHVGSFAALWSKHTTRCGGEGHYWWCPMMRASEAEYAPYRRGHQPSGNVLPKVTVRRVAPKAYGEPVDAISFEGIQAETSGRINVAFAHCAEFEFAENRSWLVIPRHARRSLRDAFPFRAEARVRPGVVASGGVRSRRTHDPAAPSYPESRSVSERSTVVLEDAWTPPRARTAPISAAT